MKKDSKIIVLVGPKGSGKTTIGRMLQKFFICKFFEFDKEHLKKYKTWKNYLKNRKSAQINTRKRVINSINNGIPAIFEIVAPNDTIKYLTGQYRIDFIEVFASKKTILLYFPPKFRQHGKIQLWEISNALIRPALRPKSLWI